MNEAKRKYRPDPGWKRIAGPVWEHVTGTRVHLLGIVRLPDGRLINANQWPAFLDAERMIRINGGNRKRGLMAWAMQLMRSRT